MITTDTILDTLKKWVEEKQPISPATWIDACSKLNILKGDEIKKLYDLQQGVARSKMASIDSGMTVAKAKAYVDTLDTYKELKIQEAKIDQIDEQIKISKLQARMGMEEYKGN